MTRDVRTPRAGAAPLSQHRRRTDRDHAVSVALWPDEGDQRYLRAVVPSLEPDRGREPEAESARAASAGDVSERQLGRAVAGLRGLLLLAPSASRAGQCGDHGLTGQASPVHHKVNALIEERDAVGHLSGFAERFGIAPCVVFFVLPRPVGGLPFVGASRPRWTRSKEPVDNIFARQVVPDSQRGFKQQVRARGRSGR